MTEIEFIVGRLLFSGHGAAPARFYGSSSLGASRADSYVSSLVLYELTIMKRSELNKLGSIWNASSFGSTRSASTVSGKTHGIDDEFESADAAATGFQEKTINEKEAETGISKHDVEKLKGKGLVHSSYWGTYPAHISREDGSPWPWNSFRPWETYSPDTSIDLKKHHVPKLS